MKPTNLICLLVLFFSALSIGTFGHNEALAKPQKATKASPKTNPAAIARQEAAAVRSSAISNSLEMDSCEAVAAGISRWKSADSLEEYFASRGMPRLRTRNLQKGEFETTPVYEARVRSQLVNYVGDSNRVVFRIPLDGESQHYDADEGVMRLSIRPTKPRSATWHPNHSLLISEKETTAARGTLGQTAIGITFRYNSYLRRETFVMIDEADEDAFVLDYLTLDDEPSQEIQLKLDAKSAMALSSSLELVLFGRLEKPFFEKAEDYKTASLDSKYERYTLSEFWFLKPQCGFLYDSKNKQILYTLRKKIPQEDLDPRAAAIKAIIENSRKSCKGEFESPVAVRGFNFQNAYPQEALNKDITGSVDAILDVDEAGNVVGVSIEFASPKGYFENKIVEEAFLMKYAPARCNGLATATKHSLTVTFAND